MPLKAELTKEIEEGFQRLKPYTYESANEEQIKRPKVIKENLHIQQIETRHANRDKN